ncbi:YceH family protein [Fimbriiglobus ruber]|uniref:Virulence factor mviM n=1 Tax=Fimbriiglobus ruber TaxID=1908690 RepID=A0A225DFV8_9BACT|nr:DUF480 domain-containing protein [Fimbriiglobus ruber]OWK40430.1 Virulence factor mviM [Fimbriiglobus ruber]
MSDAQSSPAPTNWEPVPPYQRRVLGVLIEKQKTSKSADAYPMTLNSITTGCNQKSNRDPVYELDEVDVEETLDEVQGRGLVMKMTGGRTDRWRHLLYEAWKVTKVEMAILAELLLRGPQTEGDLRGRASRMDEIKDLEELRALLKDLASRNLVVFVTPPDRRGTVVTHGFHTPEELTREKARHAGIALDNDPAPPRATAVPVSDTRLATALDDIAKLKETVARLEQQVEELRKRQP